MFCLDDNYLTYQGSIWICLYQSANEGMTTNTITPSVETSSSQSNSYLLPHHMNASMSSDIPHVKELTFLWSPHLFHMLVASAPWQILFCLEVCKIRAMNPLVVLCKPCLL